MKTIKFLVIVSAFVFPAILSTSAFAIPSCGACAWGAQPASHIGYGVTATTICTTCHTAAPIPPQPPTPPSTGGNTTPTPITFWSELSSGTGKMTLYRDPNTNTPLKQLPDGWGIWVSKDANIVKTTEGNITYRWYAVTDKTDDTIGWMKAGIVNSNDEFTTEFLKYSTVDRTNTAQTALDGIANISNRSTIVYQAVNHYYNDTSTISSLMSSGDGSRIKDFKNLPVFTVGNQQYLMGSFPVEVILGLFAQENDSFDNKVIAKDFGHGVSQATLTNYPSKNIWNPIAKKDGGEGDYDKRGAYSKLIVYPCVSEGLMYKNCYTDPDLDVVHSYKDATDGHTYKFYANTVQSIFANTKDGLGILREKFDSYNLAYNNNKSWDIPYTYHAASLPEEICAPFVGDGINVNITLADMRKIVAIKGYNGFNITNQNTQGLVLNNGNCYLSKVADKILNLKTYFPSFQRSADQSTSQAENLAKMMQIADSNKASIRIHSPGILRIIGSAGETTGIMNDGSITTALANVVYDESLGKSAEVYFPDSFYKYQVVGDEPGTYSLTINNTSSLGFSTVEINAVPLALNEIYTYQVDWDAIARNEKGVQVSIDHKGDGTDVDTFYVGANLTDALAPVTTPIPTGTSGLHGWFTSDVSVSLSASDGDGAGVKSTFFSLDNGAWQLYDNISLIPIAGEGTHTVQYYSTDFLGNQELVKTLEVKIDKTAPEAVITADPALRNLKVTGIDNLSPVSVTEDIEGYLLTDDAGHTEKLFFKKYDSATLLREANLSGIQYDNSPIISLPETAFHYEWNTRAAQPLISQEIEASSAFHLVATYLKKTNETVVDIEERGPHLPKQSYPGLKIFTVTTNKGVLGYRY